ncbi:unnamed protein product [Periconia digitata]|uniref:Uncharacterized protein n=1 Tax=Periconia digitata TaxID=1303443 RepID=A0A9W4U790_9PLEO|nr:unnamed protein product [Periconia digitata]
MGESEDITTRLPISSHFCPLGTQSYCCPLEHHSIHESSNTLLLLACYILTRSLPPSPAVFARRPRLNHPLVASSSSSSSAAQPSTLPACTHSPNRPVVALPLLYICQRHKVPSLVLRLAAVSSLGRICCPLRGPCVPLCSPNISATPRDSVHNIALAPSESQLACCPSLFHHCQTR